MKRLLITGATGTIGQALSTHLATKNYKLVLTARDSKKLSDLSRELENKTAAIKTLAFDYEKQEDFTALKRTCSEGLDGLVLITPRIPPSNSCFPENNEWETLFNSTFVKPLGLIKNLLEELALSTRAKVVIVSGIASTQYLPNYSLNGAIRAAWLAQTKAMAFQYGPQNIHFNTISLGGILNDVFKKKLQSESDQTHIPYDTLLNNRVNNVPLQKYASMIEVSQTIESLLSEVTDHMTGMNFICDGGFTRAY